MHIVLKATILAAPAIVGFSLTGPSLWSNPRNRAEHGGIDQHEGIKILEVTAGGVGGGIVAAHLLGKIGTGRIGNNWATRGMLGACFGGILLGAALTNALKD